MDVSDSRLFAYSHYFILIIPDSGVMFDAIAHGLPFVASNLPFFEEFAAQDLGITVRKREPEEFSNALETLGRNYSTYRQAIFSFKKKLDWEFVAQEHAKIYRNIVNREREIELITS